MALDLVIEEVHRIWTIRIDCSIVFVTLPRGCGIQSCGWVRVCKVLYITVEHEALRCVTAHPLKFKQYAKKIDPNGWKR